MGRKKKPAAIKSGLEAPDKMEPLLPGCTRVTAKNFKEVVLEEGCDVFLQEFADWCPWCVIMHQYTNNLAWVMDDVPNVKVCKIDSVANDISSFKDWLESEIVPNWVFLPDTMKQQPKSVNKVEFGVAGEGTDVDRRLEDMVVFIYKNMTGTKFNEDKYRRKAQFIQGRSGFLSMQAPGYNRSWIDLINGKEIGEGVTRQYKGCPALDGGVLSVMWKQAISAAKVYDSSDGREIVREIVKAQDLVMTKLKHQLWLEKATEETSSMVIEQADRFRQRVSSVVTTFLPENSARDVFFWIPDMNVLRIDTNEWRFQVQFTLHMEWQLKNSDVFKMDSKNGNNTGWMPPAFIVRNNVEDVNTLNGRISKSTKVFCKAGTEEFWGRMTISMMCDCFEEFELGSFPFDVQPLSMILDWETSDPDDTWKLIPRGTGIRPHAALKLADWTMHTPICQVMVRDCGLYLRAVDLTDLDAMVKSRTGGHTLQKDERQALIITLFAGRSWTQFICTVIYIIAILGLAGNCAFLMHPVDDMGVRLAVILIVFLAACALQTVVASSLPKLRYISYFQSYVVLMNVLIILSVCEICYSKLFALESDEFFLYINISIWVMIQVVFVLYAVFFVRPAEKNKLGKIPEQVVATFGEDEFESRPTTLKSNLVPDDLKVLQFDEDTIESHRSRVPSTLSSDSRNPYGCDDAHGVRPNTLKSNLVPDDLKVLQFDEDTIESHRSRVPSTLSSDSRNSYGHIDAHGVQLQTDAATSLPLPPTLHEDGLELLGAPGHHRGLRPRSSSRLEKSCSGGSVPLLPSPRRMTEPGANDLQPVLLGQERLHHARAKRADGPRTSTTTEPREVASSEERRSRSHRGKI